ncbi:MAG: potassium transporter Kup [Bdellovibrionales bacterium RIFCSPHIGHO2_01_FULL_40_29]|nr:MAG: potassium transporter Kup [Bdellovibrionales bacterium RIFCSPHIGHO2_01_FULL_40_29]OFZ34970.1 MAG: potassium transporter Kup [Bdellovibrionales bacterium RIFCSPHIGHO2_02_FULL_40_15]
MSKHPQTTKYKLLLTLAALGVVYGDIGTSPLYALKEAFHHSHLLPTPENIMGILSLIFWSLILVISVKYLVFILRADDNGEGGILALTSLIKSPQKKELSQNIKVALTLTGVFGAAFLYGDGIITPAISILSAVEGLRVITPVFDPYIIPITVLILVLLFSVQKNGTGSVGKVFGPVTLLWFLVIGFLGAYNIFQNFEVLKSVSPFYAYQFFVQNSFSGFVVLGSVFLVVTGGEALYSDLGHFGIEPIRKAWFYVVLPCLLLNYFGQGSFLLDHPEGVSNPFFSMAPAWSLYPLVVLATLATTIASQALITGVFSISMQAVQQGYLPRALIRHTSENEFGQIYIKNINYLLMMGCILLVLIFKTSSNLAAAYGIAVTLTMIITTLLFYVVAVYRWGWNVYGALALCSVFAAIDLAFLGANLLKILDGGWFPMILGIAGFIYMSTWKRGREILNSILSKKHVPLIEFMEKIARENIYRSEGTSVFMSRDLMIAPLSLINTVEHLKTAHKNLIFVSVKITNKPKILGQRYELTECGFGCYQLLIHFGYLEKPNVPAVFNLIKETNPIFDKDKASFFIGRENIFATALPGMAIWREKLFSFIFRNELPATEYFELPKSRVVEVGTQVEI